MDEPTMNEPTLQSIAEQWASTYADVERAEEKARLAKDEASRLRARCGTLGEMLSKRVGPNSSVLVFDVEDGNVLIVEHSRGLRLVEKQRKDR